MNILDTFERLHRVRFEFQQDRHQSNVLLKFWFRLTD